MSRLVITLASPMSDRVKAAHDRAVARAKAAGVDPPSLIDVCEVLLGRGLQADEAGQPVRPDEQALGSLTVGQLARMFGLPDASAAQAANARAKQLAEAAVDQAARSFADVPSLVRVTAPIRLRSAADVAQWAGVMQRQLTEGPPTFSVAIMMAVFDEASRPYMPAPGDRGAN